jgi:hypothetical protein
MEAKMTHGLATASQWINITVNCAMEKIKPDDSDLADTLNKIMKPYQYTIGDTKLRISFRDFVPIPLYCGIPIDYTFRLQSGDPLPKIFTADNFIFTRGGYIDVFTSTRKVISDTRYTILITGEVPQDNPPLAGVPFLTSTMVLPLEFIIPNTGPPTFKSNPSDIRLKVNEVGVIKFSTMSDPDWEDLASLQTIEFGEAFGFIMGNFPQYKVMPRNNDTDPGIYQVNVVITDDNPVPQQTSYTFKIYVNPLPPVLINVMTMNLTKNSTRKAKPGQPKLETRLKSVANFGLATVIFS